MGYSPKKIAPRMKDYEDDGSWMWVAFAPECRLIVAFVIGPRKQHVADELLKLTAKCLSESIPLFVSDGLKFYTKALLNEFGEIEEFPRTGKRGRPRNPKIIPPDNLRYAQVKKEKLQSPIVGIMTGVYNKFYVTIQSIVSGVPLSAARIPSKTEKLFFLIVEM